MARLSNQVPPSTTTNQRGARCATPWASLRRAFSACRVVNQPPTTTIAPPAIVPASVPTSCCHQLAQLIGKAVDAAGYQRIIAEELNVDASRISRYVSGQELPSYEIASDVADMLRRWGVAPKITDTDVMRMIRSERTVRKSRETYSERLRGLEERLTRQENTTRQILDEIVGIRELLVVGASPDPEPKPAKRLRSVTGEEATGRRVTRGVTINQPGGTVTTRRAAPTTRPYARFAA